MNKPDKLKPLPFSFAKRKGVLIHEEESPPKRRQLIFRESLDLAVFAEVQRFCSAEVVPKRVDNATFDQMLSESYQNDSDAALQMIEDLGDALDLSSIADAIPDNADLLEQEDDAPIIKLINSLLGEAIKLAASDIHIETYETRLVVRFRVDGVLKEIVTPRRALAPLLVSRIKVMARLDIAEKRVPQDGRITVRVGGKEVDVRVSTIPANNGERVVMRLLDKQAGRRDLSKLGMNSQAAGSMRQLLDDPHAVDELVALALQVAYFRHLLVQLLDVLLQVGVAGPLVIDLCVHHPVCQHHQQHGADRHQDGGNGPGARSRTLEI